ncbi:MAG: hypothetical protein ABIH65_00790 [Nanoarchaeota archaeon]
MFFAEKEEERFPKEIRKKIYDLKAKDKEIYHLSKEGENINLNLINFTINSLSLFLEYEKRLNNEQKNLMTEAIGNIPITFFILDNLKVDKKIEETINPLINIADAPPANLHINRKKLIIEVLHKLEKIKNET